MNITLLLGWGPRDIRAFEWTAPAGATVAMALTQLQTFFSDGRLDADAWQVANQMTGQAQMMDANEVRENSDHVSELIVGRG